jgi:hypothetical protein
MEILYRVVVLFVLTPVSTAQVMVLDATTGYPAAVLLGIPRV